MAKRDYYEVLGVSVMLPKLTSKRPIAAWR